MVNKNQNDKVKDALSKSDCGYELIFIFYEPGCPDSYSNAIMKL